MQTSVKELMSGDPISVRMDASALEAYETMLRHGIRHLPVVGPGVGELMTHAPRTLDRDATLAEEAEQMAEGRFGCLPIVDEKGRLEGMLTETDLLYALAARDVGAESPLRRKQDALAALVAELESERARIALELDRRPMDLPERSAEMDVVSLAPTLDGLAARRLAALDHALDHARQGRLSVCDGCGGPISLPRLRAFPGTTLCIDCARRAEAR
ncbi:MAG TPA: CBS domain-containing protein [Myxococcota bacterium]|nr:CBS domain-containing protein [Myxococcota bacterium]